MDRLKKLIKRNKTIYDLARFFYRIVIYFRITALMIFFHPLLSTRKLKSTRVEKDLVVSFTSYKQRINYCPYVIESILAQKVQPEKIILWLSKKDFKNDSSLPKRLKKQIKKGLDIRFIERDLGPHTKYYYAFKSLKSKNILTIDDDII